MLHRRVQQTAARALRRRDPVRHGVRSGMAVLLAVAGVLVCWCGSAQARLAHPFLSSFGSFASVQGVAVESGSGTVYVYDGGAGTVYKFDASGKPVNFTATGTNAISVGFGLEAEGEIAVDNSSGPAKGDIYVPHGDRSIEIFSAAGAKLGELSETAGHPWGEACGVAVGSSGAVYVGLWGSHVNKYVPSANPVTNADYVSSLEGLNGVCGVAADSAGNVFAVTWSSGPVTRYAPGQFGSSSATGSEVDAKGSTLAVDPANDEVYVDERNQVAQFGPQGEPFKEPVLTFAGSGQGAIAGSFGVAVSGFNHEVYVSDGSGHISVFGPAAPVPTVVTGSGSKLLSAETATVTGTVNPEGLPVSECFFEYGESTAYGNTAPCEPSSGEIGSGTQPVSVHATLTGLAPGGTYHYRLVAANSNGSAAGEDAYTISEPVVSEEYATDVTATGATFHAQVNPMGGTTTYRFEYGPSTSYGSSTPQASAGSGLASQSVQQFHAQGLSPSTVYHYRLVAANSVGTTYGPDQTLTTQPAGSELALLDGRQWEMVSPPNKHGALITGIEGFTHTQAADDGHAISWGASSPTELEPQGYMNMQVLSKRGPGGWSSLDIATPHNASSSAAAADSEYLLFSPDLSLGLVEPNGKFLALAPEATERTPYLRDDASCMASSLHCYTPLVTAGNVPPGTKFGGNPELPLNQDLKYAGASRDLSHILLESFVALTPDPIGESGLYEWTAGQLKLVSVLPENEAGVPSVPRLGYYWSSYSERNAVSYDGSRVFWTAEAEMGPLYVRDTVKEETVRIGSGRVRFQLANRDGSRVFFTTESKALEACDIVEVAGKLSCETTQLATGVEADTAVLGGSEDGSTVYFASSSVLASGAVSGTCGLAVSDSCNLYVERHANGGWESPELIGVLSGAEASDWAGQDHGFPLGLTARVSPNGRWLTFLSQRDLTGYDTRDAVSGQPDEELYLYDAASGKLSCASCNPTGARPNGVEPPAFGKHVLDGVHVEGWLAANIPAWTPSGTFGAVTYQSRYLSDSGRLFFHSSDALVPQDVNGTWDVYEYEPPGVGSCTTASLTFSVRSGGCVDLVSSGESPEESAFLDASENGDDVFFLTTSRLTGEDFDTSYDIYDAHVCSAGPPCMSVPVSPPPCSTGDSCKAAPSPQPSVFGVPPSATFAGIGNLSGGSERAVPRSLSRAQKLKRALRACHRKKGRRRRVACRRRARKRYRAKKATRGSK